MQRLDLSGLVHFQNIDAFEVYFAARFADPASCPFHCRPVAGDKNFIFSQTYPRPRSARRERASLAEDPPATSRQSLRAIKAVDSVQVVQVAERETGSLHRHETATTKSASEFFASAAIASPAIAPLQIQPACGTTAPMSGPENFPAADGAFFTNALAIATH